MSNDPTPDLDVECNVVSEFALSMALTSESLLRYSDRMQMARSEDERAFIRKTHAELLKRTVRAHRIAFAAMTSQPNKRKEIEMKNFAGIMKVIGAGAAAALGVLAVPFTAGASITVTVGVIAAVTGLTAAGSAAGALYHESPSVAK